MIERRMDRRFDTVCARPPPKPETMKRVVATLYGRVQTVGYRELILDVARGFTVGGSVCNLRTGQVEVDVEGPDDEVDRFIDAVIDERPVLARIDCVDRRALTPRGVSGFRREATR
jgi:acylphosphatase